MKKMQWVGIGVIVIVIATAGYLVAGGYNIAADEPHWVVTSVLINLVRERSIETRAETITVPTNLSDAKRVAQGAGLYAEMCVECHLAPGLQDTELRKGLYPQPPNLTQVKKLDSREAYYVITHGIKLTAMPAWGKSHSEEQVWDMVAFLHKLPELTPERFKVMTASANLHEHGHEHGEAHEHAH